MIFSGHVAVLVNKCQVATLGPGETFGELGLQNLERRTATVKASISLAKPIALASNGYDASI